VLGYKPKYSSLDTISEELPYFLKNEWKIKNLAN
jgi:hypothetical protein